MNNRNLLSIIGVVIIAILIFLIFYIASDTSKIEVEEGEQSNILGYSQNSEDLANWIDYSSLGVE